jgi:hypothetical protein
VKEKLRPIYEKRCTDDKWPAESMECFAKAEGMPQLKQCREKLPEVAKRNLIDQIRIVMTPQGGGSGMPPRGHGSGSDAPPSTGIGSDAKAGSGSAAGSGSGSAAGSGSGSGSAKAPK